jgi:hypothetical protein
MKRQAWLPALILSAAVLAYGAAAQAAMTGGEFLKAPKSFQDGFVNGFVRGMFMTCLDHLEKNKQVCSFESVLDATFDMTPDQVLNLFLTYLKQHPQTQEKEASELLTDCLKDAAEKRQKSK